MTGCDTTSRFHGIGKRHGWELFRSGHAPAAPDFGTEDAAGVYVQCRPPPKPRRGQDDAAAPVPPQPASGTKPTFAGWLSAFLAPTFPAGNQFHVEGDVEDADTMKGVLVDVGQKAVRELYSKGGSEIASMAVHRRQLFNRKVTGQTRAATCLPLPPTIEALSCQIHRVCLQVQDWLGRELPPVEWGFQLLDGALVPVPTTRDSIAPLALLKFVKCGCKGSCSNNQCACYKLGSCSNNQCACYKLGVTCTECCTACKGQTCDNHVEGSGNGAGLATAVDADLEQEQEPDYPTTPDGFVQYVDSNSSDQNMDSLRAYSEARGWAWQDVLAGSAGDGAEAADASADA
jgi:hypothetical protein